MDSIASDIGISEFFPHDMDKHDPSTYTLALIMEETYDGMKKMRCIWKLDRVTEKMFQTYMRERIENPTKTSKRLIFLRGEGALWTMKRLADEEQKLVFISDDINDNFLLKHLMLSKGYRTPLCHVSIELSLLLGLPLGRITTYREVVIAAYELMTTQCMKGLGPRFAVPPILMPFLEPKPESKVTHLQFLDMLSHHIKLIKI